VTVIAFQPGAECEQDRREFKDLREAPHLDWRRTAIGNA
jgi:hypothetical protein